jgi:hypothetical protein
MIPIFIIKYNNPCACFLSNSPKTRSLQLWRIFLTKPLLSPVTRNPAQFAAPAIEGCIK